MKLYQVCSISVAFLLTACAGKLPPQTIIVKERAPAFCEYPHDLQPSPDHDSLTIQELRDLANRWVGDYCILHKQYRECLRLTTGGASIINKPEYCDDL